MPVETANQLTLRPDRLDAVWLRCAVPLALVPLALVPLALVPLALVPLALVPLALVPLALVPLALPVPLLCRSPQDRLFPSSMCRCYPPAPGHVLAGRAAVGDGHGGGALGGEPGLGGRGLCGRGEGAQGVTVGLGWDARPKGPGERHPGPAGRRAAVMAS